MANTMRMRPLHQNEPGEWIMSQPEADVAERLQAIRQLVDAFLKQFEGHGYTYATEKAGMRHTFSQSTLELLVQRCYEGGLTAQAHQIEQLKAEYTRSQSDEEMTFQRAERLQTEVEAQAQEIATLQTEKERYVVLWQQENGTKEEWKRACM